MPLLRMNADGRRIASHHRQPLIRSSFALSGYAAAVIVLLCTLVLLGYACGWQWAWRPIAGDRAVHPLSALALIVIAWATMLARPHRRSRIGLVIASGLAIASVAALLAAVTGNASVINALSPFSEILHAEALAGRPVRVSSLAVATVLLLAVALLLRHSGKGEPAPLFLGVASLAPMGALLGYVYGSPGVTADIGLLTALATLLSIFAIAGRTADRIPIRSVLTIGVPGKVVRVQMIVLVGLCLFLALIAARSGYDDDVRSLAIEAAVITVVILLALVNAGYRWRREEQRQAALRRQGLDHPLAPALRNAWNRGEMFLLYQPQIRLSDKAMVGVEALVRWRHPIRGLIGPNDFIPIAEQTGLIGPLGTWIFQAACRQIALWESGPASDLVVAVNVSAYQLNQSDCAERLIETQRASGAPADRLVIEVTESTLIQPGDRALQALRSLNDAGLLIAIDDFGTGYSSLSSLRLLPARYLKIDRSFIEPLPGSQAAGMIVRAVIGMGRGLGMRLIAEGVETQEQEAYLAAIGCEKAQGYLYGAPMTAGEIAERARL